MYCRTEVRTVTVLLRPSQRHAARRTEVRICFLTTGYVAMYFIDDPLSDIHRHESKRKTDVGHVARFVCWCRCAPESRRRPARADPHSRMWINDPHPSPCVRHATPKTPSVVDHATRSQYFLGAQLHLSAHERKDVSASLEGKIERLLHGGERHLRFQLHEADALGARQKADG